MRFFTADFHLSMNDILRFEHRPFETIDEHDKALLQSCFDKATASDVIIHVGDLYSFGKDRGNSGGSIHPEQLIRQIPAQFINIRGNHDINNKVTSLCESLRIQLGNAFKNVSISHYPSYDRRAEGHFLPDDIHLCGHVHSKWKHCLDIKNHVLNINVGVDVWDYQIVSEQQIVKYIIEVLNLKNDKVNKFER